VRSWLVLVLAGPDGRPDDPFRITAEAITGSARAV